jgi:hypothetical protein
METLNLINKYQLTPEEELAGVIFTDLQRAYLHNLLAEVAEKKLYLKYTPQDQLGFLQQEAELQGQFYLLSHLLASSTPDSISI